MDLLQQIIVPKFDLPMALDAERIIVFSELLLLIPLHYIVYLEYIYISR